jgi:predicted nucleic acid-binding protein
LSSLVLDASVAIKWVIPSLQEPLIAESQKLLRRFLDGEVEFVVPDFFWAEVGNVLRRGSRQQRWSRDQAEAGAEELLAYNFDTVPSLTLLPEALLIAFDFGLSVYDCLYVALAASAETDLITADERLVNALAARFPVKWLGAF